MLRQASELLVSRSLVLNHCFFNQVAGEIPSASLNLRLNWDMLAKQLASPKNEREKPKKETFLIEAEISMTDFIGKPVRIDKSRDKFTMSIDCKTEEELKELIAFISREQH